jgi:hypothetical protein
MRFSPVRAAAWSLLLLTAGISSLHGQIATLAALQDCIGANGARLGYGSTCQLAPGQNYTVPFTASDGTRRAELQIGRSGITITGTMSAGPADTVIRRGDSTVQSIMTALGGVTNVTVSYLTIDGNRYGAGLGCTPGNAYYYDLVLDNGGIFTVQWMNFINGPGTALTLGGIGNPATGQASTVSLSTFGNGGYGYGPSLTYKLETAQESANRSTAIWLNGTYTGAYYNFIAFAGTAAINMSGANQAAYGNLLQSNRYEDPDGSGGGQLYTDAQSTNGYVAGNVINGNFWPGVPVPALATGCSWVAGNALNAGIEAYGFGHGFFNNEIEQHTGAGIQLAGSNPTGLITISSANPSQAGDTPRYIESNEAGGIGFLGPATGPGLIYGTQGVTLDDVLSRNNSNEQVYLSSVSGSNQINYFTGGTYNGYVNNACLSSTNPLVRSVGTAQTPLLYPVPASYTTYRGGACPSTTWSSQTPAVSHQPGWRW